MDPELAHLERTRAEKLARAVLPVGCAVWTAAEVMHLCAAPGTPASVGAGIALTAVAWGVSVKHEGLRWLPWWAGAGAVLLASADKAGPLAWWPAPVLTGAWVLATLLARRAAFRHDAVTSAREWRDARANWLAVRNQWGFGGCHLLDFEETLLGVRYTVSTKGSRHRASHFATRGFEEGVAEELDLPVSRVQVTRHGLAGRVIISIRFTDPWEKPILHPLAREDHEITLPARRSILDPAAIGQDPETGRLLTVPLCDENGTKRVSVIANSGGGKGVLEDNLFEHVTACDDAIAVHLNLSEKGYEDEGSWGPACHLTAYGPAQKDRAAAVLKAVASVIEWRTQNFKRGRYAPSREHPAIIIFHDESDSGHAALREDISTVVTKGRSHGVGYVRLGQRNTRGYVDPTARSQDNVRCTGLVQNSNEARHAGSGTGPDMSTYGEGKPGVWKVELLGAWMHLGRTWIFHPTPAGHGAAVERIAQERAFTQPQLTGACREYLGQPYELLLSDDVFAKWARARGAAPADGDAPPAPAPPAPEPAAGGPSPEAEPARGSVATADEDHLERMWEMDVDDSTRARLAGIHEKLAEGWRALGEAAAMPEPAMPQADREALAEAAWRELEQAKIPAEALPVITRLLEQEGGTTSGAVARACDVSRLTALTWLGKFRDRGLAYVEGEKRNAAWRKAPPPAGGDAQLTAPGLTSPARARTRGRA